jgi:hypothetical protein
LGRFFGMAKATSGGQCPNWKMKGKDKIRSTAAEMKIQ